MPLTCGPTEPMFYKLRHYDFLDFGASKGGSIDFAKVRLGGRRGLGIDSDSVKVEQMRRAGYACIEADVNSLDLRRRSVRFVTMSHFLEHLHDLDAVASAIASAANVSSHFLFIQGPYFDADEYLEERGLKFYWSDWHGHRCHLTTEQLRETLLALGLRDYLILGCLPVLGSSDASIHPLASPRNQHDYEPDKHPQKPIVEFDPPLYREMVCIVRLRPFREWDAVVKARRGCRFIAGTLSYDGEVSERKSSSASAQ